MTDFDRFEQRLSHVKQCFAEAKRTREAANQASDAHFEMMFEHLAAAALGQPIDGREMYESDLRWREADEADEAAGERFSSAMRACREALRDMGRP